MPLDKLTTLADRVFVIRRGVPKCPSCGQVIPGEGELEVVAGRISRIENERDRWGVIQQKILVQVVPSAYKDGDGPDLISMSAAENITDVVFCSPSEIYLDEKEAQDSLQAAQLKDILKRIGA